jgi:hypothetical protein
MRRVGCRIRFIDKGIWRCVELCHALSATEVVDHTFVGDFFFGICANVHTAYRVNEWFFVYCQPRIVGFSFTVAVVMMLVCMMLGVSSTHESLLGQIRLFRWLWWNQLLGNGGN